MKNISIRKSPRSNARSWFLEDCRTETQKKKVLMRGGPTQAILLQSVCLQAIIFLSIPSSHCSLTGLRRNCKGPSGILAREPRLHVLQTNHAKLRLIWSTKLLTHGSFAFRVLPAAEPPHRLTGLNNL